MGEKIKEQTYQEGKFRKLITKVLRKNSSGLTIKEIVILTGLPTHWIEFTLRKLMNDYPCRLEVSSNFEIRYQFDFRKKRYALFEKWIEEKVWNTEFEKQSLKQLQLLAQKYTKHQLKKDLFLEKIILNYIQNNGGKIVIAEVIQLTGWSIREAETEITQLLANYNGQAEVTTEGVIVYTFEDFCENQKFEEDLAESLKVWERPIPFFQGKKKRFNLFWELFQYSKLEKKQLHNMEHYILKGIFHRMQSQINPDREMHQLLEQVKPHKNYSYWWNESISSSLYEMLMMLTCTYNKEAIFRKKALELEAEIIPQENGQLTYEFGRLQRELSVIASLKKDVC